MLAKDQSGLASAIATETSQRGRSGDILLVAVAFLGSFSFWPALIALGSLFETLNGEFGWTRSQVTTAQLIFTVVTVAAAPVIGPLIDRYGVRPLLLTGLALVPVALLLIGSVDSSHAHWITAWVVASIVGQLVAPPVWSAGVARRFSNRRGLALGFAACGFAAATAVVPIILVQGIGLAAWRDFYYGMAGFLWLGLLPLTFLFFHDRGPDQRTAVARQHSVQTPDMDASFSKFVLRSRRFWQLGVIIFLVSFAVGGMMIHLQPLFRSHGFSAAAAASAYAFYGIGGVVGRLLGGWLLDRFHTGPLPALPMCLFPVFASIIVLAIEPSFGHFALVALLIGIAAGVEVDVVPYLVRRYYPARFFGRAYISLAAVFVAGAGASPFIISLVYDATSSYGLFLGASVLTGLIASGLLLGLGRYSQGLQEARFASAEFTRDGGIGPFLSRAGRT